MSRRRSKNKTFRTRLKQIHGLYELDQSGNKKPKDIKLQLAKGYITLPNGQIIKKENVSEDIINRFPELKEIYKQVVKDGR